MTDLTTLAVSVLNTMKERDLTLATAESITGGLLGATLTSVPGASRVYLGGVIAYANNLKERMLGVDSFEIRTHSVISGEVAAGMASGARELTRADWAVAVTGVAGPDPQDGHAPGEVWISVVGPQIGTMPSPVQTQQFWFTGDRQAVREATADAALGMILRVLSPV